MPKEHYNVRCTGLLPLRTHRELHTYITLPNTSSLALRTLGIRRASGMFVSLHDALVPLQQSVAAYRAKPPQMFM